MSGSAAFDAWVEDARSVPIAEAARRYGARLLASSTESVGACPACGGTDRFAINHRKRKFFCRQSGAGGDVIALTRYLKGCDFKVACEILTGRPPPGRSAETAEDRVAREAAVAKREAERAKDDARAEVESERFRQRERARCWEFWQGALPLPGTPAEAYLRRRGLVLPPTPALRCALDHPLFADGKHRAKVVHRGPALLAALVRPDGRFGGVHATWIDLSSADGKARVPDPTTGEFVTAKKVRGSARGGHIPLVPCHGPDDLVIGEGSETTLSVWRALTEARGPRAPHLPDLARCAFWSAYSLGNIAGPARDPVDHPTLRRTDRNGRDFGPQRVPGPVPDLARPGLPIPSSVRRIWLLGDGDSDRFTTETALERAARRFRAGRLDLDVRAAWAPMGEDFNDVLRRAAA